MLRVKDEKKSICLSSTLITDSCRKCFPFFLHYGRKLILGFLCICFFFFPCPVFVFLSHVLSTFFTRTSVPLELWLLYIDQFFYILPVLYSSSLFNHTVLLSSDRSTTWDCICKWEHMIFSSVFWFIIPDIRLANY